LTSSLAANHPGYESVLAWKGSLFLRQQRQRAFASGNPEARQIQGQLADTSRQLGRLYNASPKPEEAEAYRKQLAELAQKQEQLEAELSRLSAPFAQAKARAKLTPEALAAMLPPKGALVDMLEYSHYTLSKTGKSQDRWERRYLAWVLRPGKPVAQVPMGSADGINDLISRWRTGIAKRVAPVEGEADPALAQRDKVLGPLLPHLDGVETLLISPDSQLGTLPFAARPGRDKSKYLIEELEVAVVPFAQALPDLMAPGKPSKPDNNLLVALGDVSYGGDPGKSPAGALDAPRGDKTTAWNPLPATKAEVEILAKRLGSAFPSGTVELLQQDSATEGALRAKAVSARWLHLATHGYFSPPEVKPLGFADEQRQRGMFVSMERERVSGTSPGLLSGIVLAGANQPPVIGKDDGILTASEVQDLDLTGVEQAVLSACETGLGQSAGGEGLLGLQRGFQLAGCRTEVASMWKVPDGATKELMTRYYDNIWDGKMPKGQALRKAQLAILRGEVPLGSLRGPQLEALPQPTTKPGGTPPIFWAAWVLSGAWN